MDNMALPASLGIVSSEGTELVSLSQGEAYGDGTWRDDPDGETECRLLG